MPLKLRNVQRDQHQTFRHFVVVTTTICTQTIHIRVSIPFPLFVSILVCCRTCRPSACSGSDPLLLARSANHHTATQHRKERRSTNTKKNNRTHTTSNTTHTWATIIRVTRIGPHRHRRRRRRPPIPLNLNLNLNRSRRSTHTHMHITTSTHPHPPNPTRLATSTGPPPPMPLLASSVVQWRDRFCPPMRRPQLL